ncbi:MAG: neutral/alkaline non-lysosomal ceramidase N-terminal domain-containing protein [Chloroherpetonaceae bacterium]|nr:neutral/alkaline non-lysosomal ceramidase N-terminal domain-containing protein [Chthonomonadaceae bacterium]MDW8206490.1 neutral/alkaline non-lysosomal ceramidase N-terminal domain-containing protein [Chloroherpetonaceae bacterium]
MPLYAGVSETNITPPADVWLCGYAGRPTPAAGVHDELFARALVLDNGVQRLVLVVADLIALEDTMVRRVREGIADCLHMTPGAVMLHCTHTHAGPHVGIYRCMGVPDPTYQELLVRKLIGVARQAAAQMRPARLSCGEAPVQIGVNRRQARPDGRIVLGTDFGGPVAPTVQTLCIREISGQIRALLFCHACHPTTMGGENLLISAEWPGVAVALVQQRLREENFDGNRNPGPLAFCLQGCCGDINPILRGTWEAVEQNGRAVAEAACAALWQDMHPLDEQLDAAEITVEIPMLPPPSVETCDAMIVEWQEALDRERARGADEGRIHWIQGRIDWARSARTLAERQNASAFTRAFSIQRFTLGGAHLIGFPAEMFVQYQLDLSAQARVPIFALSYTNGCWNYLPTAAEYARGGYEIEEAYRFYGTLMFAPECEPIVRDAAYALLQIDTPDRTPYPLQCGRAMP